MSTPTWSRRPFIGSLPKGFRSSLPAAEALVGLGTLLASPDIEGSTEGDTAWLRPKGGLQPPAVTLKLKVVDASDGAKIECRFDASKWDAIDLGIYALVAAVGFEVAAAWFSGRLAMLGKDLLSSVTPLAIAGLATLSTGHYAFRRWRQSVRNRLFDRAVIALGVPIS